MLKAKRKRLFRFLYIITTLVVITLIGLLDSNMNDLLGALKNLNLTWLLLGFACLIMFWVSDTVLLSHVTSYMYGKLPFWKSFKISIIGLYYGALTPFATGGQPMQVVYMKREKIPYGTSTGIVSVKFVIYELSLCLFYITAMIFRGSYFYTNYSKIFWFTTIGFSINLFAVVSIAFIMANRNIPSKICRGFINFFHKIKIIKKPEKNLESVERHIEDFHETTEYIKKYKWQVLISIFISLLNLIFLFAIPYFIYVAFGHSERTIIDLITLQSFLYLAVSFVPLPGGAGVSEGGFYLFFSTYFTKVPVFIAMLAWRFMSYYVILIVGSLLVVADEVVKIKKDD